MRCILGPNLAKSILRQCCSYCRNKYMCTQTLVYIYKCWVICVLEKLQAAAGNYFANARNTSSKGKNVPIPLGPAYPPGGRNFHP